MHTMQCNIYEHTLQVCLNVMLLTFKKKVRYSAGSVCVGMCDVMPIHLRQKQQCHLRAQRSQHESWMLSWDPK